MKYAEIINGAIAQIIETNAALPMHKQRATLLPIEDVTPTYDPATQGLGAETLAIEGNRVARTWSVVTLPPKEPTPEEKIAALRSELDSEKAKVAALETVLAGNADAAAPDARTDIKAIIAALTAKEIVTSAEIDAQRRSSYRDNGDGTISRLDKLGLPAATFTPGDRSAEAATYATWLSLGGKPLPFDPTAVGKV